MVGLVLPRSRSPFRVAVTNYVTLPLREAFCFRNGACSEVRPSVIKLLCPLNAPALKRGAQAIPHVRVGRSAALPRAEVARNQ
jgi:hypothetical protein